MQQILNKLEYETGSAQTIENMCHNAGKQPFSDNLIQFLSAWSRKILKHTDAKKYPDVITFAFWIRRANVEILKERFDMRDRIVRGRGVAFHIAPSNVAVNYAYSLVVGLLTGNANIVRIPSKQFPQTEILNKTLNDTLLEYTLWQNDICLVRYGHDREVNDALSSIADTRIIWGGDATIREIRQSILKPRAYDICFADRYSLAVIDVRAYLECEDKVDLARKFYNDTYMTDQNACTSPRIVVWHTQGTVDVEQKQAYHLFWHYLWDVIQTKYEIQPVQAVNKLTTFLRSSGQLASNISRIFDKDIEEDNRMWRIRVERIDTQLMDYLENSGYFYEYECTDLTELVPICGTRCQTIAYYGSKQMFDPLLKQNIKGIDRIVPIGKTMEFDMIWDGYNLYEMLTRKIVD